MKTIELKLRGHDAPGVLSNADYTPPINGHVIAALTYCPEHEISVIIAAPLNTQIDARKNRCITDALESMLKVLKNHELPDDEEPQYNDA